MNKQVASTEQSSVELIIMAISTSTDQRGGGGGGGGGHYVTEQSVRGWEHFVTVTELKAICSYRIFNESV